MAIGQLLYTSVARRTVFLAECACSEEEFSTIARQGLDSSPENVSVFTYFHGKHTMYYLFDGGFVYMVLADQDVTRQVVFEFLERLMEDFQKRYGEIARVHSLGIHSLNEAYGPELKKRIQKTNKLLLCRLLNLPDAVILEIILKSTASAPKAPFVWRSLCSKLRRVVSLQSNHFWIRCFVAAFGERIAFEATSEQRYSAVSPGGFLLRFFSIWMVRYSERLIAGDNLKEGSGRERNVVLEKIKEALIACDELSGWTREALNENRMILDVMKLESNLLLLALSACTISGYTLTSSVEGCPIVVWNLEREAVQAICAGRYVHRFVVQTLELDRWGTMLLSGGHNAISVWDVESGQCLCHVDGLLDGPWGGHAALKSLQWVDVDGGVARDRFTGAPIPKKRDIEELEEWGQRTGASRTLNQWPAISAPRDDATSDPALYWGPEGERHSLLDASNETVLGCAPQDRTLLAREALSMEDGILCWVYIAECSEMRPGMLATVWSASPREPIPHPIRRFKHVFCFDKLTGVIALQGSSCRQIHLADTLTGQEVQTMSLSTGSHEAEGMRSAEFSHSASGWRLVLLLERNELLVADITTGHALARLQCGPEECFYSVSCHGRIFALKCPWAFSEDMEKLPPSRQFSLVDVEAQSSSRFEDLGKRGEWVPLQVKNLVGGYPSATSIWMGPDNATILLWTEPGCDVATLSIKDSSDGDPPEWDPEVDFMDSSWRWLAVREYGVIHVWDVLLSNKSQESRRTLN